MTGLDRAAFWERVRAELPLAEDEDPRIYRFASEVARWSDRVHLVGRRNIAENVGTLVLDSLHLLRFAHDEGVLPEGDRPTSVADIGSGAGFPGMVWKIVRPDLELSLFERRRKPSAFLERTIAALGITGVRVIVADAERRSGGQRFDIVLSKAAGRMGEIGPIAAGMLEPGGAYMTIKGPGWREEVGDGEFRAESTKPLPGNRGTMLLLRERG